MAARGHAGSCSRGLKLAADAGRGLGRHRRGLELVRSVGCSSHSQNRSPSARGRRSASESSRRGGGGQLLGEFAYGRHDLAFKRYAGLRPIVLRLVEQVTRPG